MNSIARLCESPAVVSHCIFNVLCSQLDLDPLIAAVKALEALAHDRTVLRLKQESDDTGAPQDDGNFSLPYDPASVFLLETMISATIQRPEAIEEIWYEANVSSSQFIHQWDQAYHIQ